MEVRHSKILKLGLEGRMAVFCFILFCLFLYFLQDRFNVRIGNILSEEQEMSVPQVSVLPVTLFNIEINIVQNINRRTNCALFVDDFLIYYRAKNMNHIERKLQICLDELHKGTTEWTKVFQRKYNVSTSVTNGSSTLTQY